ncbi:alpha/beta hydrolase fold domain-containing protein [Rhodoplanes serenus]|uniref:Alpha/beta hydrolase fold domain-containing protein n=1 Tax=Rhodoplanes serenus TaxID=200615 RepID=A0A327JV44_9BRAD|nr:alpha/beta hydrolase [Rhodoplanes serenus]MTW18858.1 alpha/beta hydrolase fold domain-containing protein [Rhodoplanes serenus]RAI27068.1 hypothetical protein CH340_24670 [Rhodoplanes serenus]
MTDADATADAVEPLSRRAASADPPSWMARRGLGWSPAGAANLLTGFGGFSAVQELRYGDGPRGTLDVYAPPRAAGAAVVVFFYGGSWQSGAKEIYRFVAAPLARRGHVVVVPDYRVHPQARFPEFLEDGAAAVAWAAAQARRFGADPRRLVLMGHSAGAHIAAMLATERRWLAAVGLRPEHDLTGLVGLAGPYDFGPLRDPVLVEIFGGPHRPETYPINHVRGGEPPALLLTGARDRTVHPGNTARFAARLRAAGGDVRATVYPRPGHVGLIGAFVRPFRGLAPVLADVDAFVRSRPPADKRGSTSGLATDPAATDPAAIASSATANRRA